MRSIVDAKDALTSDGGVTTIYEVEDIAPVESTLGSGELILRPNRFELADGLGLTMVGHGEYKADQTSEVYLVKAETLPAGTT